LLKLGRHLRLSPQARLVVGRDERENNRLMNLTEEADYLFYPDANLAGPTALGRGDFSDDLIRLSSGIVARYCDLNGKREADIIYRKIGTVPFGDSPLRVVPVEGGAIANFRV
jgi:hypothetical protein